MTTQTDKLRKHGVNVTFEYDNDNHYSLKNSKDIYAIPLWRPEWAYNFVEAEEAFQHVTEDDYTGSLCCLFCCSQDCEKCYCCSSDETVKEEKLEQKKKRQRSSKIDEFDKEPDKCQKCLTQFFSLNPFFNIHYFLHLVMNLPIFYISFTLIQTMAFLFRIVRWFSLMVDDAMKNSCNCCCDCSAASRYFIVLIVAPLYLAFSGLLGALVYWVDIVVNALLLRPLICAGLTLDTMWRNTSKVEPISPNLSFRLWIQEMLGDWAKAADVLINDPDDLDANGKFKDPIISPKLLLSAMSVLPNLTAQTVASEVLAPFLIQMIIL